MASDLMDADIDTRPLLLGHRGARSVRTIQENSPASFDRALADGCDGFEFDVRLAGDGDAVIWHDPEFNGIEIATVSARELPGLARLEEVLARYWENTFLDIELKVPKLEKITVKHLRSFLPRKGFVVSSFLPEVLRALRDEDSDLPLGLICETTDEFSFWARLPIQYVIPNHSLLRRDLVAELKAAGMKILVWTVNNPADMKRFRDWGVDGIISDDARLLCHTLSA
jgi:glycerophosphoryl diester phosphodiesterase